MRNSAALLVAGVAILTAVGARSEPPPKPSVVPVSWDLEFEHGDIQSITLKLPGEKEPRTFWYMLFTVTNRTEADQIFVPGFFLYTSTGQVLRAGTSVPAAVFKATVSRHNNPLLKNLTAISGRLLQGEDNAKDGVAIWPDFDPAARKFDIFIGGLSGERARIKLPTPIVVTEQGDDGRPKKVPKTEAVLAKTLQLSYSLPGDAASRTRTKPKRLEEKWVMR